MSQSPARGGQPQWFDSGYAHVWMPYTQMKTALPPLPVVRTYGTRLVLADGVELVDGTASWWTAVHGYNHPAVAAALAEQAQRMSHVMFGGLANEPAFRLAARLAALLPGDLERVFFSESGSVSVEVALKMALCYWRHRGAAERTRFLAFRGAYHGDTLGAMSVCDPQGSMHAALAANLPQQFFAELPSDDERTAELDALLARHGGEIAAVIVEPLVQGAGGMLFHDAATLARVRRLADKHDTLLICDEIFTGFGRTGTMFASQAAHIVPDIVTLSKALGAGTLPLAATVARPAIFDAFWSDEPARALMHGPTYMGNALACAVANASLDLFETQPRLAQAQAIAYALERDLGPARDIPGVVDVRVQGAIGVIELERIDDLEGLRRRSIARGVWIRPFRNVVYLTPALTIDADDLARLTNAVIACLAEHSSSPSRF